MKSAIFSSISGGLSLSCVRWNMTERIFFTNPDSRSTWRNLISLHVIHHRLHITRIRWNWQRAAELLPPKADRDRSAKASLQIILNSDGCRGGCLFIFKAKRRHRERLVCDENNFICVSQSSVGWHCRWNHKYYSSCGFVLGACKRVCPLNMDFDILSLPPHIKPSKASIINLISGRQLPPIIERLKFCVVARGSVRALSCSCGLATSLFSRRSVFMRLFAWDDSRWWCR